MNKEHDLEGCSDEEVDDPLDQEETAPVNQEVNSVYSHHDGSKSNFVFDPTFTVGPISHEEAVTANPIANGDN
ncbi:hypothetical protein PSHT_11822 [Puccinia striiformis]|uniref:Uncharacterized protein n=3 Tax=Puccinia striiformis TaxID=27350 RepID=A0A0L0V469_9BASI|nr:hypothetical protein KEM48_002799 [Puccinia striiformis f. sp. tritici PST-130]KNE94072.1 hypothetical protein PSTG_12582 [Puccinia striiformis f. sp. tritici PST-78]POW03064.1 hypothetical protein PSHT_11822 [Puccinia striiformis]POW11327.1 hypothetical protein PSTT_05297 [Puccinia striiformis]